MDRVKEKFNVGVIVARFQTYDLTDGHKDLIKSVLHECQRVIILLGISPTKNTVRNPLDFTARKQMILSEFPEIDVLYIADQCDDRLWSNNLDNQIESLVGPNSTVALYGSRDSFIRYYTGKYPTVPMQQTLYISGTAFRNDVSHNTAASSDFRKGAIWAANNRYENPHVCVDVIIFRKNELASDKMTQVLLGKKPNEHKFRFIGGFVDYGETIEDAAIREVFEETNLIGKKEDLRYIGSFVIDDWRYRGEKENIVSICYSLEINEGVPIPQDDIEQLQWVDLSSVVDCIIDNHKELAHTAILARYKSN